MTDISEAADHIRNAAGSEPPALAIVLGSGLGALAGRLEEAVSIPFSGLPGFPVSGVSGHQGALHIGNLGGARTAVLSGRVHYYEEGDARAMKAPLAAMAALGCEHLALSNAAGSTRRDMPPGSLMAIRDHLNWSGMNPLIGVGDDGRFVDMTQAYDAGLAARFRKVAQSLGETLEEGVYAWYSGPSFETPAEIRALSMLGADAVGMSTVPEVILARYYGMRVAAVSVITNFAAGMAGSAIGHDHTKSETDRAQEKFCALFTGFAGSFSSKGGV